MNLQLDQQVSIETTFVCVRHGLGDCRLRSSAISAQVSNLDLYLSPVRDSAARASHRRKRIQGLEEHSHWSERQHYLNDANDDYPIRASEGASTSVPQPPDQRRRSGKSDYWPNDRMA